MLSRDLLDRVEFERIVDLIGIKIFQHNSYINSGLQHIRTGSPTEDVLVALVQGLVIQNKSFLEQAIRARMNQPLPELITVRCSDCGGGVDLKRVGETPK